MTLLLSAKRDFTRPTLVSVTVSTDGQTTALKFSEVLNQLSVSAVTAFSYSGTAATVAAVSVVGDTVFLTNGPVVHQTEVPLVSYAVPGSDPIQDTAHNNALAFSNQAATNNSTVATPLGDSFWQLYFDVRDYEGVISSGSVISAPLVPRIGAGVATPFAADSVSFPTAFGGALGIGNRLAVRTQIAATAHSCFSVDWLASLMSGVKKPGTFGARFRRTTAANAFMMGFGKAASAVNSFYEIYEGAVGQANIQKNDGVSTLARVGTTVIGSAVADVFFTISPDGNTGKLYVNGAQEGADLDLSTLTANVTINQCRLGNTGRSTPGGQGLDGFSQVYCFSTNTASAADILAVHNAWVADDRPAPSGGQVFFCGDSTTVLEGMRLATYNYATTHVPLLNISQVGPYTNTLDSFPGGHHGAINGATLLTLSTVVNAQLGAGNAFPGVKLVHLLAAVNDLNDPGASVPAILTAYGNLVTNILTRITGAVPTARCSVTTIQPLQPGSMGEAEVVAFNAGLPAVWNAIDAAFPANTLIRWDLYAAIGGAWNGSLYLDATHPNATGYAVACADPTNGLIQAIGPYLVAIG